MHRSATVVLAAFVLTLLLLDAAACGGGASTAPSPATPSQRVIGVVGSLSFGNVTVGSKGSATLTITNSGDAPLTVTGLSFSSGLAAVFSASFTGAIPAGQSKVVTVQFSPAAAQTYSGALTIAGDQTSGVNSVAVSGTGTPLTATFKVVGTPSIVCRTGLCLSAVYTVTNVGPACMTEMQFITRFLGADGAGPQLGIDIPMTLVDGGSLYAVLLRPGDQITLQNLTPFNDVRSAHSQLVVSGNWLTVPCP